MNPHRDPPVTLRRGEDFDVVVLALPIGAQRFVCAELAEASEPFGRMLDALPTVATQSLQLWRTEPPPERADAIVGGHDAPFDTACDMTHVEEEETWEHGCVRHISYHCGVLEGRERAPQDGPSLDPAELSAATASVRESAERFVGQAKPPGLSADTLADGQGRPGGTLDHQYWRANVAPGERYVQSPAGSIRHRLRAGASGFDNVVLAGDWTATAVNAGSVEAAVMSGREAAAALAAAQGLELQPLHAKDVP